MEQTPSAAPTRLEIESQLKEMEGKIVSLTNQVDHVSSIRDLLANQLAMMQSENEVLGSEVIALMKENVKSKTEIKMTVKRLEFVESCLKERKVD